MQSLFLSAIGFGHGGALTALFLDTFIKGALILTVAVLVTWSFRRSSAATRFAIWLAALALTACLPVLSLALPRWQQPIWTVTAAPAAGNEVALTLDLAPRRPAPVKHLPEGGSLSEPSGATVVASRPLSASLRLSKLAKALVPALWAGGAIVVLLRFLLSHRQVRMLVRAATRVAGLDTLLNELTGQLRVLQPVTLLASNQTTIPMTWGTRRPVILLPAAAPGWAMDRLKVVLLHELAHIKRSDCLTYYVAVLASAIHWMNPLAWLALRMLRLERERACDDLVLAGGCKPSDYACHLVDIARSLRPSCPLAGIAMIRPSQVRQRVASILDASRRRRTPGPLFLAGLAAAAIVFTAMVAAQKPGLAPAGPDDSVRQKLVTQLESFAGAKLDQARRYAALTNSQVLPEFQTFFDAAIRGDFTTVTNMYDSFKRRHPQYESRSHDERLAVNYWQCVLETSLAYFDVAAAEPRYVQQAIDDFLSSIPSGSIYFGGTDPGRGLPTAFSKSHERADPFFTLTQNALADGSYLEYLRRMYGARLYIPSDQDSQDLFETYKADAQARMAKGQLRPGEDVRVVDGKVEVKGQVAVMAINALLAKLIFDKNPGYDFYVEESYPLDWMYPRLEPHGLIMKVNREPIEVLPDEVLERDGKYWTERVNGMLGSWLTPETSANAVADFVERVYVKKKLEGFSGDPLFVQNWWSQAAFSKWRTSIAGTYAWRATRAIPGSAESERMAKAADFAFRQGFALCPTSPEALYRYVNSLVNHRRYADAIRLAEVSDKLKPSAQTGRLIEELKRIQWSNEKK